MKKLIILSISYLASFVFAERVLKYDSKEFITNAQVNNDVDKVNNSRMKKSHYRSYSKKRYSRSYSSKRWEKSHSWKKSNSKEFITNAQVNNDVDRVKNWRGKRLLATEMLLKSCRSC
jgi:hypothetical protein